MGKTILYIDDDPDDRELLRKELQDVEGSVLVEEVENGQKALDFLLIAKNEMHLPCLIVLDLNMPVLDGRQTFLRIKQDERLNKIPIVVFTSSQNPNDVAYFNQQGVQYISKPMSTKQMKLIAQGLVHYCS